MILPSNIAELEAESRRYVTYKLIFACHHKFSKIKQSLTLI